MPSQSSYLMAPLPSTTSSLPVASSPPLSSKPLSVLMFVALAVVRVDVRHTVTIVVDAVARCAVAIIVDNGKTPALRQWQ